MARGRERDIRSQKPQETKRQEERDIRRKGASTGQERGDTGMPQPSDFGRAPDAANTRDPKPFPSRRHRSGPGRKF